MTDGPTNRQGRSNLRMLWWVVALASCAPESSPLASSVAVPVASAPAPVPAVAGPAPAPVIKASATPFAVKGVLAPDQPLGHGDYLWEEAGVGAGPLAIVVDLEAQILYVYRGGMEVGRSAILYGADDKPTPTGTFPILEKDADHVSNLYDAPMPYMLRLTMDGIAIHGSTVQYGYATHGCVGVPDEFAEKLFANAKIGDRVLITHGWRTDIYGAEALADEPLPV